MNAQPPSPKSTSKGNIYLLMKKDQLQRLQQFKQTFQRRKSLQYNNSQNPPNHIKHQSPNHLSNKSIENDKPKVKCKIDRKDSEVSIVQDFLDDSKQASKRTGSSNEKQYVVNVSTCPKTELISAQKQQNPDKSLEVGQRNQNSIAKPETLVKNQNFKSFFQYILDFKLTNKQSYSPKNNNSSILKCQESINPKSKKLQNSLAVQTTQKQAEKNLTKPLEKTQNHEIRQTRNRQLQMSQISLVDVRISSASIEDFNPMFKSSHKKLNTTPNSEMKKQKQVYFDFQNPQLSQSDYLEEQHNPMVQSENNVTAIHKSLTKIVSLEELKKRIQNTEEQLANFTHHGYFCDECKVDPIVGKRYRCMQCDQYDLCEKCYKKECENYGRIMKKYDHHHGSSNQRAAFKSKCNYLFEIKPLLKKNMSDILEEEILSQNVSSDQNCMVSSDQDFDQSDDHVHLMEQVQRARPKHQINLDKILRETNRGSLRSITGKSNNRIQQNFIRKKEPSTPCFWPRDKLVSSMKMMKSKIVFSERAIPTSPNLFEKVQSVLIQSKKKEVQNLRKSSQSILNLFK